MHCVARFLGASILYHMSFLKTTLSQSNPLFSSLFLTSSEIPALVLKTSVHYAWEECQEISIYKGENHSEDSEIMKFIRVYNNNDKDKTANDSVYLEHQNIDGTIPVQTFKVRKATGIPAHVMLLADMQRVIYAQHTFLHKMKIIINEEFDKREVGHATFQVQKQVEQMLTCFQDKIIKKVDSLGSKRSNDSSSCDIGSPFGGTSHGGRWFFWGGAYRRVSEDWVFPNKMTLRSAWHRYFVPDHESGICALRYLTGTDMVKQSNGRRNLASLKMSMNYMIEKLKKDKKYIDKPSEDQVNAMYKHASCYILRLSNSSRSELFSWHTHVCQVDYKSVQFRVQSSDCPAVLTVIFRKKAFFKKIILKILDTFLLTKISHSKDCKF